MKKIILVIIGVMGVIILNGQTPYWKWARNAGSTDYDEASSLLVNRDNNLMVAGFFRTTAYLPTDTLTAGASNGMFLAEYDRDGTMLWVKHVADATGSIVPSHIFQDPGGNYFVVGTFGLFTFGGAVTFLPSTSFTSAGNTDIFVAKFNGAGLLLWAQVIQSAEEQVAAYTAAMDFHGNVFVSGRNFSTHTFSGTVSGMLPSDGSWHIYLAEYDAVGFVSANNIIKCPMVMYPYGMVTDERENIYIAGKYTGRPVFGIDPDTFSITESPLYEEIFLAKFSTDVLDAVWAYPSGGPSGDFPFTLDMNEETDLIMTGVYNTSALFHSLSGTESLVAPFTNEIFIVEYDTAGIVHWAKNAGHSPTGGITITDGFHNMDSSLTVTGNYTGIPTFGEGVDAETLAFVDDLFVAEYDHEGKLNWVQRAGGGSGENSYRVVNDSAGNSYIAGYFNLFAVFDTSATDTINLISRGYTDILVARLGHKEGIGVGGIDIYGNITDPQCFILAPNPALDEVNVTSMKFNTSTIEIDILDLNGRSMDFGPEYWILQGNRLTLDVNRIPTGIYIVVITAKGKKVFK